jgi:hypothetical protein
MHRVVVRFSGNFHTDSIQNLSEQILCIGATANSIPAIQTSPNLLSSFKPIFNVNGKINEFSSPISPFEEESEASMTIPPSIRQVVKTKDERKQVNEANAMALFFKTSHFSA